MIYWNDPNAFESSLNLKLVCVKFAYVARATAVWNMHAGLHNVFKLSFVCLCV